MARQFASVDFLPGRKQQTQPQLVRVLHGEFLMDRVVLHLYNEGHQYDKYKSGRPVQLRWGWLPDAISYFYGYVHHTQRLEQERDLTHLQVICIGAVYPMLQPAQRTWSSRRSHDVISSLAFEHRFSCSVERDDYAVPLLTQHGRSDWAFAVALAKRRGYTFYATNTDLVYLKRRIVRNTRVPAFVKWPDQEHRQRNSIYEFEHTVGETVPLHGKKATRVQRVVTDGAGVQQVRVDPALDQTLGGTVVTDPVFTAFEMTRTMTTAADAQANLKGIAETNRFHISATAKLSGHHRVHQGSTIRLTGLDSEDNGFWYVREAEHVVDLNDYVTYVELGRDSMGDRTANAYDLPGSVIKNAPVVIAAGVPSSAGSQPPPVSTYDSGLATYPVTGTGGDQSQTVANGAHRAVPQPVIVPLHTSEVSKIVAPRLHAWKATASTIRQVQGSDVVVS